MKQHTLIKRAGSLCLAVSLMAAFGLEAAAAGGAAPQADVSATLVAQSLSNDKATVDTGNLAQGYIRVKYTGGKSVRIKVQVIKSGGATYTYDLNNAGNFETFPLTEGNGDYTIKVMENVGGTKYAQAYSGAVTLSLTNSFTPFLYPNQYVNYTPTSKVVAQGKKVTAGASSDVDKIGKVFDYVVDNFSYDYDRAASVASGYLPNIDSVLAQKKGICFDYAAVMTAMLRSQGIPCKLIVGYAGKTYHAWINAYVQGVGWVDQVIYFDGKNWTLMDPTFVSSGKRSDQAMKFVTTTTNYTQKYAY